MEWLPTQAMEWLPIRVLSRPQLPLRTGHHLLQAQTHTEPRGSNPRPMAPWVQLGYRLTGPGHRLPMPRRARGTQGKGTTEQVGTEAAVMVMAVVMGEQACLCDYVRVMAVVVEDEWVLAPPYGQRA